MKKLMSILIILSIFMTPYSTFADVFDGMMEIDNSILFETNALDLAQMGSSFDMTFDNTLPDISPILIPDTVDAVNLLFNNNDLNTTVEADTGFDDMTLDLDNTVNDLDIITDFTNDSLNDLFQDNMENLEIVEGEIVSPDGDNDPSNDFPPASNDKESDGDTDEDGESDSEEENKDNDDEEQKCDACGVGEEAFLFDFLFSNVVYADEINSQNRYYLRTENASYLLNSNDDSINYFISLIANKHITVQLTIKHNSSISVDVSYVYAVDDVPQSIWDKYSDFCTEELKKEYPYGIFFTNNNIYYFLEEKTDEMIKVKTDEPELEILIPLIANQNISVAIAYSNINSETIYINEIILLEDLPEDIANEYSKQYKEYEKTILYNFTGYLGVVDSYYSIITDYGTFKLSSELENILSFIVSNSDKNLLVKVHGFLDSDTMTINVIQIDY